MAEGLLVSEDWKQLEDDPLSSGTGIKLATYFVLWRLLSACSFAASGFNPLVGERNERARNKGRLE